MEEELIALVKKYFPEAKYSFEKDLTEKLGFYLLKQRLVPFGGKLIKLG